MEKQKGIKHELSCGCGHCDGGRSVEMKKGKDKFSSFIKTYFIDLLSIILAMLLWVFATFLPIRREIRLVLYICSALVVGYKNVIDFIKDIMALQFFGENTLILIAGICAFVLGQYGEGALIMILYNLGEFLESVATDNSKRKIAGLVDLKCEITHVFTKSGIIDLNPSDVKIGSLIQIKKGERIPIDGVLIDKYAIVDMKTITGESKYYELKLGDKVLSGGINVGDAIVVRTEKVYEESTSQKIIELVENSLSRKAKSQKFISKFSKFYTPIIVCVALLVAVVPPLFDSYNFVKWIYKALSFLVISCPCALVISIPLAFYVGIGGLAKKGILVKGSCFIETLSGVNAVAFDKTGTLTNGEFVIDKILTCNDFEKSQIIEYAIWLENYSTHPLAKAVCSLQESACDLHIESVTEISGKGMAGIVDGNKVLLGNVSLLSENGFKIDAEQYEGTILYLVINGVLAGKFYLCDKIKENAIATIDSLKRMDIEKLSIISGDNNNSVKNTAKILNIQNAYGSLLPADKLDKIKEIKSDSKSKVLFVGDGVNDAPVIAFSDVGVSMGGLGSEIAIETSDVVIMDDNVNKIVTAIKHSRKVKNKVLQNIIGSIFVKVIIMALSIFINLPVWLAIFADVGVMLLAVVNSLMLGRVK